MTALKIFCCSPMTDILLNALIASSSQISDRYPSNNLIFILANSKRLEYNHTGIYREWSFTTVLWLGIPWYNFDSWQGAIFCSLINIPAEERPIMLDRGLLGTDFRWRTSLTVYQRFSFGGVGRAIPHYLGERLWRNTALASSLEEMPTIIRPFYDSPIKIS